MDPESRVPESRIRALRPPHPPPRHRPPPRQRVHEDPFGVEGGRPPPRPAMHPEEPRSNDSWTAVKAGLLLALGASGVTWLAIFLAG